MPVKWNPSSGTRFHSLQATSQALQPIHTEVSVKNPTRGGWSRYPLAVAGSVSSKSAVRNDLTATAHLRSGLFGDAGASDVFVDQGDLLGPPRAPPRPDVPAEGLHLLDVGIGVEGDRGELVRRVSRHETIR